MNPILTVMRAEYLRAVRTKAFLVGVLVTPILFGGGFIAMTIAETTTDTRDRAFAVIDRTEVLLPVIREAVDAHNERVLGDDGEQLAPRWLLATPAATEAGQREDVALSERAESGELMGFLEIGADLLAPEGGEDRTFDWHTDSPTQDDLSDWLRDVVNEELRRLRFDQAGFDPALALRLARRASLQIVGLAEVDASTGEVSQATEMEQLSSVIVPAALVFLMFMLVMMSTPALMSNVLEEKMQKIAEVLVSSVRPFDLLMGKLLSAVLVSLTLAVFYVGGIITFLNIADSVPAPFLTALTPQLLLSFLGFMLLALFIYGSVFSALGAACSEIQDTQTLMMPAMIVFVLPMMFLGPLINSPDGTLAQVLTFIPPATPVVLFLRMHVPPGAPLWQVLLALAVCVAFAVGCVWAGAKIFRIGILSQGQAPSYRKLISWLRSG